ncbi:MAG TPA: DegT/DnrJ/EryC1/StrS family aminotransferase [Thermoanaerobaculia bacterium]|nr:DegT/DnrJ/EryC1/StrS family aminotransferase [Thermoanaerobaculia bacterium]
MTSIQYPFWKPEVGALELGLVEAVLDSAFLNDGDITQEFELRLAERLGARHVVAVTSGTAAITLALMAAGVGPGHEVLVPDITFIATANAVTLAGAKPVLVDVDPATLMIDVESAQRQVTGRCRAVIPVHLSGRPADLPGVQTMAAQHGLVVIEDAAEGFLSRSGPRFLGTHGQAGCFSFSPNKTIMTGQGGAIATDDDDLHYRLRELKDQGRPARGTGGADLHVAIGYNFKLTNLQAAVGLAQLSYVDARVDRLRDIYREYCHHLRGVTQIRIFDVRPEEGQTPQWVDVIAERRDELEAFLLSRGAQCRKFWFPLHTQAPYLAAPDRFPVSSVEGPRALWLPSAFQLSSSDIETISRWIREFYEAT